MASTSLPDIGKSIGFSTWEIDCSVDEFQDATDIHRQMGDYQAAATD